MQSTRRNFVMVTSKIFFISIMLFACMATFADCALAQRGAPPVPERPKREPDDLRDPPGGPREDIWNDENGREIRRDTYTSRGQRKTLKITRYCLDGSINELEYFYFGYTDGALLERREKTVFGCDMGNGEAQSVEIWEERTHTADGEPVPAKKTLTVFREYKEFGRTIGPSETEWEWDPDKGDRGDWVHKSRRVGAAPGPRRSSAANGFAVASEVSGGLNTTNFSTPRGKIRVHLPNDVAAGDTISGTVIAEPEGKDQKEQARNKGELSGYVVEMEKQHTSSTGRILKLAVPAAISTTHLILRDKGGKEVARCEVPVARQPPSLPEFDLPTLGQHGRPLEVRGPFDGNISTTHLTVGGQELEVLAESPRQVVARNTSGQTGPSELEVTERDQTVSAEFRTLGLNLSAPKLELLRGEQTTLSVTVSGLEGIKEDVPLVLENKSSSVIQMAGGEVQRINIGPSQVKDGTYTIERSLTGVKRGAFTITGTVVSGRQRPGGPIARKPGNTIEECDKAIKPLQQCTVKRPCDLGVDSNGDGKTDICLAGARCAPASEGTTCAPPNPCVLTTIFTPKGPFTPVATCECKCQ